MRLVKALNSSKIASRFFVSLLILASTTSAFSKETQLTVDQASITKENTKYTWVNFSALASNGKTYQGSITCFTADRTYNGMAHGSMNVLRERSHAGAYMDFSYEICRQMLDNLSEGAEEVVISWDQEQFDDLSSGRLSFERVIY
ncbi:MAG: hypothetical protein AB8G05_27725 [Oligoflexales bacterium]